MSRFDSVIPLSYSSVGAAIGWSIAGAVGGLVAGVLTGDVVGFVGGGIAGGAVFGLMAFRCGWFPKAPESTSSDTDANA
jgi:hypothetical protein